MTTIMGGSFGFGQIEALLTTREADIYGSQAIALVLNSIPTRSELRTLASYYSQNLACLVIPKCSHYSHEAFKIWELGVPCFAAYEPVGPLVGRDIIIDFERSTLSCIDANLTSAYAESSQRQNSLCAIDIYAEALSAEQVITAKNNGATALGIVKCSELFANTGITPSAIEYLYEATKFSGTAKHLIRFFDEPPNVLNSGQMLGPRGARLYRSHPELPPLYRHYLEELRTASARNGCSIATESIVCVIPMVTDVSEVAWWKRYLHPYQLGITIETPAAAIMAPEITRLVDFVEIGANDLSQYTMAWDRDCPNEILLPTSRLAAPVARLASIVVEHCDRNKVAYTLGLDLRPSLDLAIQLKEAGIRSVSCAPSLVGRWRKYFAPITVSNASC